MNVQRGRWQAGHRPPWAAPAEWQLCGSDLGIARRDAEPRVAGSLEWTEAVVDISACHGVMERGGRWMCAGVIVGRHAQLQGRTSFVRPRQGG